jgi:protein O-GlcNAc transferase
MYGSVDIALDAFPYSGSTTTFEALWMGVPVITLAGESMVSRWTASMLHAVGMDELIATSPDDYLKKAIALAKDPRRIAEVRRTLRARTAGSSLCNGRLRARQVERLLRAVWRRWCRAKFTEPSALPSNPPGLMRWRPGDYG